ncbi:MAG: hypothetical protein MZV70_35625, partial [Desulfobacterales bacterium]|nr:hypothetical protein [Desulfobacterales bacterium]
CTSFSYVLLRLNRRLPTESTAPPTWGCRWWGSGSMYRQGYFRQFLNHEGWQQENYPETDFFSLPIQRMRDEAGNEIRVTIRGADGPIHAIVWRILIGRVPLFLLDTNILENPPEHREVTARLYAAESKIRLAQEVLLGIGGMRALHAMGIKPKVVHMNEGHCAFAGLERLAQLVEDQKINVKCSAANHPAHHRLHDAYSGGSRSRRVSGRHGQTLSQAFGRPHWRYRAGAAVLGPSPGNP